MILIKVFIECDYCDTKIQVPDSEICVFDSYEENGEMYAKKLGWSVSNEDGICCTDHN